MRESQTRRTRRWLYVSALVAIAFPLSSQAEDAKPTGTLKIKQYQVAFIGSGALGGGTLNFQGRKHEFTIGGIGIGGIGMSSIDATGEVYHLKKLEDFPGAYGQARAGIALTDQSTGSLWMKNSDGVYIRLSADRTGAILALGADGVYIDLK